MIRCKNCRWFRKYLDLTIFIECIIPTTYLSEYEINKYKNHIQLLGMNNFYNCRHYKRKWWKFWIKNRKEI